LNEKILSYNEKKHAWFVSPAATAEKENFKSIYDQWVRLKGDIIKCLNL